MAKSEPKTDIDPVDANNMHLWGKLAATDPKYTKAFNRGTYSGTAINKQYCWMKLTEVFGPNGVGWGAKEDISYKAMPNGDVVVVFKVAVWYCPFISSPELKIETTAGFGSDFFFRSSNGKTDDDAIKKAFSDALTNAAKYIGLAADVYLGFYDDDKYVEDMKEQYRPDAKPVELIEEPVDNGGRAIALEMMGVEHDPGEDVFVVGPKGTIRFSIPDNDLAPEMFDWIVAVATGMPSINELVEFGNENSTVSDAIKEVMPRDPLIEGSYNWAWRKLSLINGVTENDVSKSWSKISAKVNALKGTLPSVYEGVSTAFKDMKKQIKEDAE